MNAKDRRRNARMINKKGISQAVGFVLLLGLSVSLAIFVGIWIKERSEKTIEGVAGNQERETKCDDVLLNVFPNCGVVDENVVVISLNLTNRGLFSIVQLRCDGFFVDLEPPLTPGEKREGQDLNNCIGSVTSIIVPMVNLSNGEIFGCYEKRVYAKC